MTMIDTEVERGGQRQKLFTTLYGMYLRCAVAGTWKVAWKAVRDVYAAKFDNIDMRDDEGRAVCANSKSIATVTVGVLSTDKLYLAVREEYVLDM